MQTVQTLIRLLLSSLIRVYTVWYSTKYFKKQQHKKNEIECWKFYDIDRTPLTEAKILLRAMVSIRIHQLSFGLVWRLMAQSKLLSCQARQFTILFSGQTQSSKWLTSTCVHSFTRNRQLLFLNQWKGKNDHRKYFIINLHERILLNLAGTEPATS